MSTQFAAVSIFDVFVSANRHSTALAIFTCFVPHFGESFGVDNANVVCPAHGYYVNTKILTIPHIGIVVVAV